MRSTVVPAQITTIEDKIAGNLNVTQVLLLMTPIFLGIGAYGFIPPIMQIAWYKAAISIFTAIITVTLAIRIKDKLVLDWLIVYIRFSLRPAYYIFNKNDFVSHGLGVSQKQKTPAKISQVTPKVWKNSSAVSISVGDWAKYEQLMNLDSVTLQIKPIKKGGLYVVVKQVKT